jgi:hypothetical protein
VSAGAPPITPGWAASGFRVYGGQGATVADLDDLDALTRTLDALADRLRSAAFALLRAAIIVGDLFARADAARAAHHAIDAARSGRCSPAACAHAVEDLATRVHRAVATYRGADSSAAGALRGVVVAQASLAGELAPWVVLGAGVVLGAAGALVVGGVVVSAPVRAFLLRGPDPLLGGLRRLVGPLGTLPDRLTAGGRATWETDAVAAFLRGAEPGFRIPVLRAPATVTARDLADALPASGPMVLIARTRPPQLPAPRTTAQVLANVRATYEAGGGGLPGTPPGTITVQRLTHPDGSRAWVVAVPGTQSWRAAATTPTDLTTNLRQVAGEPDDMTTATLEAMRLAGIAPGEPVLLAGHSQGGMTVTSVAAHAPPMFDVRAVVTAGSPDVPATVPPTVEVRAYRHTEDLVPQLDGVPDVGGPHTVVVTRRLATTGGPADPTVAEAHSLARYEETADEADTELAGSPAMRGYDDAQAQVLGPPGTTAETLQFQATRDPALVATDPLTGLPRPPRLQRATPGLP